MKKEGYSVEYIAQTLNKMRRELGIKYKNATPEWLRERIYQRNLSKYQDELGPTYEWLINHGKTPEKLFKF